MYYVKDISKVLRQEAKGGYAGCVTMFSIDSRTIITPENTLFFAIAGANHDGHQFIPALYATGCRAFVVEKWSEQYELMSEAAFWTVASASQALQLLAADYRASVNCNLVAITGSNGKTIVKEWIFQMLSDIMTVYRSPRSYNSQLGVPLSILAMPNSKEFEDNGLAVIEAGISKKGEMCKLERIIKPTCGILTHMGDAHGENFSSMEEKLREKLQLFKGCQYIVYQRNQLADKYIAEELPGVRTMTWGDDRCDVVVQTVALSKHERVVDMQCCGCAYNFTIPFADEASFENVMNVITFLLTLKISPDVVIKQVAHLQPVAMRMEIKEGIHNTLLIQDYYNSDAASFRLALQTLQLQEEKKNKIVILSDFIDVSSQDVCLYESIAMRLKEAGVNTFIGIGEKLCNYKTLFNLPNSRFYLSTSDFFKNEDLDTYANSVILLKGARKFQFEYIAAKLQKQAHITTLEVDLDAMIRNLNHFRALVPSTTKFAVMVKAFTYGCGGVEIASMLQYQGVDYLMVAFADEGVELRAAGITTHIGVMNPEPETFDKMIEFGLEPEIFSLDLLTEFNNALMRHGVQEYPIHIKLNTGMNRSGFDKKDIPQLLNFFEKRRNVVVKSMFSHLAGADEACHDAFTMEQFKRFSDMTEQIQSAFSYKILRHILNSAGIERFPEYHFDMVRLGIGLHGISAAGAKLEPVASFKTHIAAIRQVEQSETIGYGRHGVLNRDSRIAVILVGYADGLDRHLSRGVGEMSVKGHRVSIVGNICMDACMLDVTDFPDIQVGDEVEIFGKEIPITELSDKLGTIPYEILTSISRRVRRVFFKE